MIGVAPVSVTDPHSPCMRRGSWNGKPFLAHGTSNWLAAPPCKSRSAGLPIRVMPTLKELARLGKPDLVAFVAPLLTELAALKARVEVLQAENTALRAQLDQLAHEAKRQAAPFSKGQRKAQPKRPGRKPGRGRFTFRTLPTPDQWTAPPIEVRLTDPVCP